MCIHISKDIPNTILVEAFVIEREDQASICSLVSVGSRDNDRCPRCELYVITQNYAYLIRNLEGIRNLRSPLNTGPRWFNG